MIVKASAEFSSFLAHNSILPYNDAFEQYVLLLLTNARASQDQDRTDWLYRTLERYKTSRNELETDVNRSEASRPISADDVYRIRDELLAMPINGKQLKEIYDMSQLTSKESARPQDVCCSWWKRRKGDEKHIFNVFRDTPM